MGSWINICPGCYGRFLDDEAFILHTEVCEQYATLPVEGDETPDPAGSPGPSRARTAP